jgi:hypothetical protein
MKDITWHLGSKRNFFGHQNFEYTSLKSWARHCKVGLNYATQSIETLRSPHVSSFLVTNLPFWAVPCLVAFCQAHTSIWA